MLISLEPVAIASRWRLELFCWAYLRIFSEVDSAKGDWISLGSSTPAGFMNLLGADAAASFRASVRMSTPTSPVSKIICFAVLASLGGLSSSNPRNCPDFPDADIEIGLGWILRPVVGGATFDEDDADATCGSGSGG